MVSWESEAHISTHGTHSTHIGLKTSGTNPLHGRHIKHEVWGGGRKETEEDHENLGDLEAFPQKT